MQPRIIGLRGPCLGLAVNLAAGETTIGREVGNTIVLNSSAVSRRHARIVSIGSSFTVEDLGSANGVKVNGAKIAVPATLSNGDQIEIGDVTLLFESPEPARATGEFAASGAQAGSRPKEVSSQERAATAHSFAAPSRGSDMSGCNPFGDLLDSLSNSLAGLMKYLPWALLAMVLCCVLFMLLSGVGALLGLGAGAAASVSGAGHSAPAGGGATPPPAPASDDQQQEEQGTAKITVLSTRVVRIVGQDGKRTPTLLVKWRNDSDSPVSELTGTVTIKLASGHTDVYPKVKLYQGAAVQPNGTHEDLGSGDGAPIATDEDPAPVVTPTEVK